VRYDAKPIGDVPAVTNLPLRNPCNTPFLPSVTKKSSLRKSEHDPLDFYNSAREHVSVSSSAQPHSRDTVSLVALCWAGGASG
jgi:hypothetical protein